MSSMPRSTGGVLTSRSKVASSGLVLSDCLSVLATAPNSSTECSSRSSSCGLLDDDVPVHGVLCFVEADWPLIGGTFTTRGVQALWPKKLYPKLQAEGPVTADTVAELHRKLAHALPAA